MTRYDEAPASDGRGGPHPLAGVPQRALDAAVTALRDANVATRDPHYLVIDSTDVEAAAHAVLAAALEAQRWPPKVGEDPEYDRAEREFLADLGLEDF